MKEKTHYYCYQVCYKFNFEFRMRKTGNFHSYKTKIRERESEHKNVKKSKKMGYCNGPTYYL